MLRDLFGEEPPPEQPIVPVDSGPGQPVRVLVGRRGGTREKDEEDEKVSFTDARSNPTPGDVLVRRTEVVAFRFVSRIKYC